MLVPAAAESVGRRVLETDGNVGVARFIDASIYHDTFPAIRIKEKIQIHSYFVKIFCEISVETN